MEIEDAILNLMKLLSRISIDQPYLGTSISVDSFPQSKRGDDEKEALERLVNYHALTDVIGNTTL
ncbi:hypothetical protein GCM10007981_18040 [Thermocladium modestius]|uniref:Uncharacterized protein n=1 Tax=Thermocladium modestius TaxID=62609 RepID=A0A830GXA6_9CREN|nr:hypothetical protein [Thermocladium modestius]GGP22346.1 hypothetical protein GCM10007981_18040 [Thermocladium modestius]